MIPLIIIRPQPGADATLAAAREMGLDARAFPVFAIRPLAWNPPPREDIDALLVGSANAMRHGGTGLSAYAGLPTYAVGDKTAVAAREAGLEVVVTGEGGLQEVLGKLSPAHRRLLRIAGREHVDLTLPEGVTLTTREVYASEPKPAPADLIERLRAPAVVMLHSGEAAAHFAAICDEAGVDRSGVALAAIGPRVADRAGAGWRDVRCAGQTSDAALLALASAMCQDGRDPQPATPPVADRGAMPDQDNSFATSAPIATPPRRRSSGWLGALLAFALGAGIVGYLAWSGDLDRVFMSAGASRSPAAAPQPSQAIVRMIEPNLGSVETRVSLLEDRLSRLDYKANAASGNAARAEGLLIAFATRRLIDRGEPLTYVTDQLRLRFANAQPRAVETIIAFARKPVTIDELSARLEALSPELTDRAETDSVIQRVRRELTDLFTVRRDSAALLGPEARIERARLMLTAGRTSEAIEQVERLPGADSAELWIADARRYDDTQRALDLIETSAMLEPRRLQDAGGAAVQQQSPLAAPAVPDAPPTASPSPTDAAR